MSVVSSVCCYCGTGCGVLIEADAGNIASVRGDCASVCDLAWRFFADKTS
ncbi:MAG: assimilatory nitrate reductase catalytic subunit [Pseudomonadota bacterium]|nr:assimilatory nitrate reductase catalytic subunit [Pseudomonadota bacterium]